MLSLVQDDILEGFDISDLLEKYGDKRDYEWYSEDFLGSDLSDETILRINDVLALGLPLEYHTNTKDKDDDLSTFNVGLRAYFAPVEGLEVTGFAKFNIPVGDDAGDDTGLGFGLETVFAF